jgi:hypothetical protein
VTFQVDAHDVVEVLLSHVERHAITQDAGIVHEDVEPSEVIEGVGDDAFGTRVASDIVSVDNRPSPGTLDETDDFRRARSVMRLSGQIGAKVVHDDGCTFGRQRHRLRSPDALAGTGDDCYLPLETTHRPTPISSHRTSGAVTGRRSAADTMPQSGVM